MFKYVITFEKRGYVKYTSHLDMQRLFKRAFRRCGIELAYTQGFNPHPKMSLAQPLSLGYEASAEMLEFEADEPVSEHRLLVDLSENLPEGVRITSCGRIPEEQRKTIAASVIAAKYTILFPFSWHTADFPKILQDYLDQEEILVMKKQKKKKELKEVNIRGGIRSAHLIHTEENKVCLKLLLDCGSSSNLSPELVIQSFIQFGNFSCERYEIDVTRDELILPEDFPIRPL